MGLLNKIKNVLFEEEEVEIPLEETKVEIKKEERKEQPKKRNVYEESEKEEEVVVQDHDLFKAEKTFDFPIFDDQEFNDMKNLDELFPEEEPKKSMSINLFDHERPQQKKGRIIPKAEEIKGRAYDTKASDFDKRKFKPSPVISPVYGVLDKNYKKEDIVVIKQEEKKSYDVAEARKKAFGTLEEKIEKNISPLKEENSILAKDEVEEEKSIDELLEATAFDTIELPDIRENMDVEDTYNEEDVPITLDVLDKKEEKNESEKVEASETLENDLFELIDSMYENREDE